MANDSTEIDAAKLDADMEKIRKEVEAMTADCEEICNDIKANAKLKDNVQKIVNKA